LNFTFDGLHQAQQSIDRLRNFRFRLAEEPFSAGENAALQDRARAACQAFEDAMDDNLNTAEALAAVFAMVRDGNTAMDHGEFRVGDRAAFLDTLDRWDRIFCVLDDNDHEKLMKFGFIKPRDSSLAVLVPSPPADIGQAAIGNGHTGAVAMELLSDEEIKRWVAERDEVRGKGNFTRADEIRQHLQKAGVILEDSKLGTRWKRK
jgi:cysteinyl-tRNA synthetase